MPACRGFIPCPYNHIEILPSISLKIKHSGTYSHPQFMSFVHRPTCMSCVSFPTNLYPKQYSMMKWWSQCHNVFGLIWSKIMPVCICCNH